MSKIGEYRALYETEHAPETPREFDGPGVLVMRYRNYFFPVEGDHISQIDRALTGHGGFRAVARWLKVFHGATVVLPVYVHDHGQLHFKATEEPGNPFNDQWDASFVGIIYDTPATRAAVGLDDISVQEMTAALMSEVSDWDLWQRGEVYRYTVEQYTGAEWVEIDGHGGCYGTDAVQREAESLMAVLRKEDAANGDPAGVGRALRAALPRTIAMRDAGREAVALIEATLERQMAELVMIDPLHPLHPDPAAHYHVRPHPEADESGFFTLFHALRYASEELERVAGAEHDGALGAEQAARDAKERGEDPTRIVELWEDAAESREKAERWFNLAQNANVVWLNAAAMPGEGAPLYSQADPADRRVKLMTAAQAAAVKINGSGPEQFTVFACTGADCVPGDDDEGEE